MHLNIQDTSSSQPPFQFLFLPSLKRIHPYTVDAPPDLCFFVSLLFLNFPPSTIRFLLKNEILWFSNVLDKLTLIYTKNIHCNYLNYHCTIYLNVFLNEFLKSVDGLITFAFHILQNILHVAYVQYSLNRIELDLV